MVENVEERNELDVEVRLEKIERAAEKRTTRFLKSYRKRSTFLQSARGGDVDIMYDYIFGEDLEELVNLLNDDADAIDALAEKVMNAARPKG